MLLGTLLLATRHVLDYRPTSGAGGFGGSGGRGASFDEDQLQAGVQGFDMRGVLLGS